MTYKYTYATIFLKLKQTLRRKIKIELWILFFCISLHKLCRKGELMYYHNLYKQYIKDAADLKAYIKTLKSSVCHHEKDAELIKWRISMLYSMYLDLKHTAEYLKIRGEITKNEK